MSRIGNALLRPVNKMFPALSGLFAIVWGIWLFVPKSDNTLSVYTFLQAANVGIIIGVLTILGGAWLCYGAYKTSLNIMSMAMFWLGVIWTFIATFILLAEWTSNSWIIYVFLGCYCFLCTAVFSIQKEYEGDIYYS